MTHRRTLAWLFVGLACVAAAALAAMVTGHLRIGSEWPGLLAGLAVLLLLGFALRRP